jgi:hypothetical protein
MVFYCSAVQLEYLSTSLTKWTKEFDQEVRQAGKEDAAYQQAIEDLSGSMQKTQGKEELVQLQDGVLYRKGLLWVPENPQNTILYIKHDSLVAGYFGHVMAGEERERDLGNSRWEETGTRRRERAWMGSDVVEGRAWRETRLFVIRMGARLGQT